MDIDDLIERNDPGIALLRHWAGQPGANNSAFLARDPDLARHTLLHLGVTTRSILGAIVHETGGVSVADGLIRLWGSGPKRALLQSNQMAADAIGRDLPDMLLIGDDAFGGLFALNGGGFGQDGTGEVFHQAADERSWHSLEVGHADFAAWCLTGELNILYDVGAQAERLSRHSLPPFDKVLAFYPFPWVREGRTGNAGLREIDADEHLRLRVELLGFGTVDDGEGG